MNLPTQAIVAFAFGVTFIVTLLIIAVRFPHPTPFQYNVFRTVLSLAAAGAAAMIPGFIDLQVSNTTKLIIRAGGALAVFIVTFFFNPARLAAHGGDNESAQATPPESPERLGNGTPFPPDQRGAFLKVWETLVRLDKAGEDLWNNCADGTLSTFAHQLAEAQKCIDQHALFFSEGDYSALLEILRAANFYLSGKNTLLDIRSGVFEREKDGSIEIIRLAAPGERDRVVDDNVRHQIKQNKRWLTHYRNVLSNIRLSLHHGVVPRVENSAARTP